MVVTLCGALLVVFGRPLERDLVDEGIVMAFCFWFHRLLFLHAGLERVFGWRMLRLLSQIWLCSLFLGPRLERDVLKIEAVLQTAIQWLLVVA